MKVGKDQVIGLMQLYNQRISGYSLVCSSLKGGYVLTLPIDDIEEVLSTQSSLNQQFKLYALEEQSKILSHVDHLSQIHSPQSLLAAKFDKQNHACFSPKNSVG